MPATSTSEDYRLTGPLISIFETALIGSDDRHDYSEVRCVALGYLNGRLHVLCFTETHHGIRVISFRKANSREVNLYAST